MTAGSFTERTVGRVVVLTIDRPEVRNALDPPTLVGLADAIDRCTDAPDVGAVVLTGAGDRCFSSGMDLHAVRAGGDEVAASVHRFRSSLESRQRLPVVAAVRGMAMGGGFEIMLRCDLVVAADDARFGLPEVTRGLVPGGGGTLLPARVPLAVALEIGLLGEPFDASRALAIGLVNRLCPADRVADEAVALAAQLAERPPATLARIRELMWTTAMDGPAASAVASRTSDPDEERRRAEAVAGMAAFLGTERQRPGD